ncbi:hypothetical protein [Streptomyces boluensis]|uniref:Lipoprotein n=1 Tax=Streptomyces boluensis TaxID=1775135 RepID=A0A964UV29_9ACTN|nr:hypothetical protein [Streptomyces boluensis]NBE55051.1 hypothetical protein [Streptomyces boluensis]
MSMNPRRTHLCIVAAAAIAAVSTGACSVAASHDRTPQAATVGMTHSAPTADTHTDSPPQPDGADQVRR